MKKLLTYLIIGSMSVACATVFPVYAGDTYNPRTAEITQQLDRAAYSRSRSISRSASRKIEIDKALEEMPFRPTSLKARSAGVLIREGVAPGSVASVSTEEITPAAPDPKTVLTPVAIPQPVIDPKSNPYASKRKDKSKNKDSVLNRYFDFSDPKNNLELSTEILAYSYEEKGIQSVDSTDSTMYGISGKYTHRFTEAPIASAKEFFKNKVPINMMAIDVELVGHTSVDYEYAANNREWKDSLAKWDVRALLGCDFKTKKGNLVTPYTGLGLTRYDDVSYINDVYYGSLENARHGRTQEMWYLPLGFDFVHQPRKQWQVKLNLEYDILMYGKNNASWRATGLYGDDADHIQRNGRGYRGSFQVLRKFDGFDIFLEPFFRLWDVEESDHENWGTGDPWEWTHDTTKKAFKTNEYGAKMGVRF